MSRMVLRRDPVVLFETDDAHHASQRTRPEGRAAEGERYAGLG